MTISAKDLHVISVISNPVRYQSRVRLFKEFLERMETSGATHWIVEAVFGERDATIVNPDCPRHIQVRCDHELWLKENLINVGASFLPADAKYIMWLDGDVKFERTDWARETVEALQHYDVVQPFSNVIDYGPHTEILQVHKSFAYCYVKGAALGPENKPMNHKYGGPYWHCGFSWAYRASAWNSMGGMIDRAICGAGDHHMALAMIGQSKLSLPGGIHENYRHMIKTWEDRATAVIKRNIGYVPGTIHHHYHGKKEDRKYNERWDYLTANHYDPYTDVSMDRHGVLQWALPNQERGWAMRDGMRQYFRERREDPE